MATSMLLLHISKQARSQSIVSWNDHSFVSKSLSKEYVYLGIKNRQYWVYDDPPLWWNSRSKSFPKNVLLVGAKPHQQIAHLLGKFSRENV